MTRKEYITRCALQKKAEREILGAEGGFRDALEVACETQGSFKYINEKGEIRLDLSYDIFKELLFHAVKHQILCQTIAYLPSEEFSELDKRIVRAWKLSETDDVVLSHAIDLLTAHTLFDNRRTP